MGKAEKFGSHADNMPVVIVGSGAAGLAAAYKLKQAGLRVKIIEAAHTVGGKLRSKKRDGFLIDQGAFFLPTTHRHMVALAGEAGFADQIDVGGSIIAVARNNDIHDFDIDRVVSGFLRTRLFSTSAKLSLGPVIGELYRSRLCTYDRIAEMAPFDTETAGQWARRRLKPELAENVVGLILRAMSGASAEMAPYVEFPALLALLGGAKLVACRGGMGAYAMHLAAGIDTELNARVQEVVPQGDGVRVTWLSGDGRERVETAAGCVVAGSVETATGILPGLDPWRREYLGRVRDKPSFILNVGLSRPPANFAATYLLLPRAAHPFLAGICANHNKAPGRVPDGKGLLTLMPVYDWCEQQVDADDERIARNLIEALDSVIPGMSHTVEFCEVSRWKQRYNPVGHYRDLGRFRARCKSEDRRIQLAGDYFGYANLESAIRSGEAAAQNLLEALTGKSTNSETSGENRHAVCG